MACQDYPPCSRENCARPACAHAAPEPHVLHDNSTWCDGYQFPEGMAASDFVGGGGGFGGGGASGSW